MIISVKNLEKKAAVNAFGKATGLEKLIFYKACSYRWEETADPERDEEKTFINLQEAILYADSLNLEVGFRGVVDEISVYQEDLEELVNEDGNIDLADIDYKSVSSYDSEEIYSTDEFTGDSIEGAILVEWSYEKFVGYAHNLINIGIAGEWPFSDLKKESDLITGNEESTFRSNYSVLLKADEIEGLTKDEVREAIDQALNENRWKWNHFKNNPNSPFIYERIKDILD